MKVGNRPLRLDPRSDRVGAVGRPCHNGKFIIEDRCSGARAKGKGKAETGAPKTPASRHDATEILKVIDDACYRVTPGT